MIEDLTVQLVSFQGRTRTVREWMEVRDIDAISARFGDWVVTSYGLENLVTPYDIAASRLWEKDGSAWDWPKHMSEKKWVDLSDFQAAFEAAREYHQAAKK